MISLLYLSVLREESNISLMLRMGAEVAGARGAFENIGLRDPLLAAYLLRIASGFRDGRFRI